MNGSFDKGRRIDRELVFHVIGEGFGQSGDGFLDAFGRIQRICTGGERDGETCGRIAIEARDERIILRAEFDAGHVFETHRAPRGRGPDQQALELFGSGQQGLQRDGDVDFLARHGWRAAESPGCDLRILGLNDLDDVSRGQSVLGELFRLQPDAHGVLRAKDLNMADAFDAADRVVDVRADIITEVGLVERAVRGIERGDEQEAARGLADGDALALDFFWEERRGQRNLVLGLHLRDVCVGAGFEGQRDRGRSIRI